MQLLDDDDDDDDLEIESEDEGDDDQRGSTQGPDHQVNENLDGVFSSGPKRSRMSGDEIPEYGFILHDDHHTIKRLQDDLLADEDEPDDGMFYFQCHVLNIPILSFQVCPHMRSDLPPFNERSQPWRPKMLPRRTGL